MFFERVLVLVVAFVLFLVRVAALVLAYDTWDAVMNVDTGVYRGTRRVRARPKVALVEPINESMMVLHSLLWGVDRTVLLPPRHLLLRSARADYHVIQHEPHERTDALLRMFHSHCHVEANGYTIASL